MRLPAALRRLRKVLTRPFARSVGSARPSRRRLRGRELAAEETFGAYTWLDEDRHPSRILNERSEAGWALGELYDVMLRQDTELFGLWEKRVKAVMGLPRRIEPADESERAKEAAAFCRQALSEVPSLHTNLKHQLEGITHGVAFDEVLWEELPRGPLAGALVPVEIKDRPMARFLFRRGQLFVRRSLDRHVRAPWGRVLCMRHGSKDSPWGAPLLDHVYWSYYVKRHAWRYFGVAIEKWAQPTAMGFYPRSGGQEAAEEILEIIEDIQTEFGIAIPEGAKIELLEATRAGQVSYEAFIALLNRSQAVVMHGEVDTSGMAKGPGSYAKSKTSNAVRVEGIKCDAHELGSHLSDQLLAPLVLLNLGPDHLVPRFLLDAEEAENRQLRQQGVRRVLESGRPVPEDYFYRVHQCPRPRPGDPVVTELLSARGDAETTAEEEPEEDLAA